MINKFVLAILALAVVGVSGANAGPLIHSFSAENGGVGQLDYGTFANFNVSQGSVDLIGNGSFDAYPGNGLYVDLAGSSGQFGALTTKSVFAPGTYTVILSLGGPIYNGITDGANVSWNEGLGMSFKLAGLATADYTFNATLLNPEAFTIADLGLSGNPNIGSTLFGIQISRATSVPEPITLSLFGAGLAGAVAARRRKKKIA